MLAAQVSGRTDLVDETVVGAGSWVASVIGRLVGRGVRDGDTPAPPSRTREGRWLAVLRGL